jgi:hypothetical protein
VTGMATKKEQARAEALDKVVKHHFTEEFRAFHTASFSMKLAFDRLTDDDITNDAVAWKTFRTQAKAASEALAKINAAVK